MARLPAAYRPLRDPRVAVIVLAGLVGFVAGTYAVLVLGGGVLLRSTDRPSVALSVLATGVVALAFEPVQSRLERWAVRRVHGDRPSAYDVLRRFSETVGRAHVGDRLPARMAQVLGQGTGAEEAQVLIVVHDRLTLAAIWPTDRTGSPGDPDSAAPDGVDDRVRSLEVRHGGELLGVLRLRLHRGQHLTPVEDRLVRALAAQAGLALHGARLRTELERRLADLSARATELQRSRERLVETEDDERRRLERDIHDGAQQQLVALTVNLRLAQTLLTRSPDRAAEVLSTQSAAATDTIATLRDLSRGIYPRALREQGVVAAIEAVAATSPVPVTVTTDGVARYPAALEATAYFSCLEALQNATKHAGARVISVGIQGSDNALTVRVNDDGQGFDPVRVAGTGLTHLRDRVEAAGGALRVYSAPGAGTSVVATIPLRAHEAV